MAKAKTESKPTFLDNLFDTATYEGAVVTQPSPETFVVEQVRGTDLVLTFSKKFDDWNVVVRVSASEGWAESPSILLASAAEVTDAVKSLWANFQDRATVMSEGTEDARRLNAINIINGNLTDDTPADTVPDEPKVEGGTPRVTPKPKPAGAK